MARQIVISCFDLTGNMMRPWAEAGYKCYCIDMQHTVKYSEAVGKGSITYVRADMLHWHPHHIGHHEGEVAFMSFFPPCTDVAVSGAKHFKDKGLDAIIYALQLFQASVKLALDWGNNEIPYMIENPVSTVSTYWRKPDYSFHPHEYGGYLEPPGDAYTKKTCLWTGGGFVMPEKRSVEPVEGSKMHLLPPSENRANLRSATPMGFAQACFEANRRSDASLPI